MDLSFGDLGAIKRGDVYLAKMDKTRPVLVESADRYNDNPHMEVIAVVTFKSMKERTKPRDDEVVVYPPEGGLRLPSRTDITDLQWVPRDVLIRWLGCLDEETMRRVDACIQFRLGMVC